MLYRVWKILSAITIGFLLAYNTSFAGEAEIDSGYWTTNSISAEIKQNWTTGFVVQTRVRDDFGRLERVVIRPSLSYRLSDTTSITAGYDAHFIKIANDSIEQRIWQQLQSDWSMKDFSISARFRLEERFFERVDQAAVRLRGRIRIDIPVESTDWKLTLSNEYFVGLNDASNGPKKGFDQNRAYIGVSRPIHRDLALSLGYQNQYIDRTGTRDLMVHQAMIGLSAKLN